MSHYPFDRSFHPKMSSTLLSLATDFRMDSRIVPWDELTSSDTIMNELAHQLRRSGWPERTYEEVRQELLRLHERWKKVVEPKSETFRRTAEKHPFLWTEESEDDDDIFMSPLPVLHRRRARVLHRPKERVMHPRRARVLYRPRARVLHRRKARRAHRRRARGLHQRRMTMMTSCSM